MTALRPLERVSPLVRTIAGHRVAGSSLDAWPTAPLDDLRWSTLVAEVSVQRIWGLLADAIASGALPAADDQAQQAFDADDDAANTCAHLDRALRSVWDRFEDRDIDARVFKGVTSAMLLYPRAGLRTYSDVDLLVPTRHFDAAMSAIESLGGQRHSPEPRPGFTRSLGKSACFSLPDGWEIDLHRSPWDGPFGASVRTPDLFASSTELEVGGRRVLGLSRPHMFVVACYHAILPRGDRRLVPLLDVAHMLREGWLDPAEVIDAACRWRGTAVVAAAVTTAVRLFGLPADGRLERWSTALRPPRVEAMWLRSELSDHPRSVLIKGAFTASAFRPRRNGVRFLATQFFHEDRQPAPVRARRLAQRLLWSDPQAVPSLPPSAAHEMERPRLGFVGFHSDGTGRDPLSQSELVAEAFAREGFEVRTTSTKRPPIARLLDQVRSVISWRNDVDVVLIDVFSGRSFTSAEVTSVLCRLAGLPYVLVLHGGNLPLFIEGHPRRVHLLCARAARLVAPSAYLADAFRAEGHEVRVIPNLVLPPLDHPDVGRRAAPRFLWMRTFERTYQPDLAVRAFAKVVAERPHATMTMAGADRGELQATIDLASELGVGHAITFAGFVRGQAKAQLFEENDVFVNTTSIDNTPVSVLEAGACGLVVVATRVGGIGVLFEDGRDALLVPDDDPDRLASAMLRACDDPMLSEALSNAAAEVAAGYAWPRVYDNWLDLLRGMGLPVRLTVPRDGVAVPLALSDLPRVARIHLAAFTDSQLSALGADALERYYRWQFLGPHENHALGVWRDGHLAGFVFGGRYRGALQGFLHRNWLTLAWGVARRPSELRDGPFRSRVQLGVTVFTGRHRRTGATSATPHPVSPRSFGVLAIAIDPAHQGSGAAATLLDAAIDEARRGRFDGMHLSVSVDNGRALSFYEREGWTQAVNSDGSWTGAMRFDFDDATRSPLPERDVEA